MQQHGSKYLPADTIPTTLGVGSKGETSTFSEHGHVAYQTRNVSMVHGCQRCSKIRIFSQTKAKKKYEQRAIILEDTK